MAAGLAALVLAPAGHAAPARAQDDSWQRPLPEPVRILRPFDPPAQRWLPGHRGVDLAAGPGSAVRAAGGGRVAFAGSVAGTGVVSVDHGGLRTTYLPVVPRAEEGMRVAAGQVIASVAEAGRHCVTRPCLHWGLRSGDTYLDPLALLGVGRVRLLPGPAPRRQGRPGRKRCRGGTDRSGRAVRPGRNRRKGRTGPSERNGRPHRAYALGCARL
ncbi:M23 family metallopeptidase [Streptomonospora wellingtoniae]|uniref:M23 family metallopeptidase n=1 Tax=Streptomonospora wellingtoniae TaxID=3075544 RepID=A0ABU2KZD5_9ACTN|nr:M23 family metallopeptidase [Streptomonospora sp. DSM 45055]MDT0304656.1 M23 family metallopeptidase [Streptomonospora sp. DSM 45055]